MRFNTDASHVSRSARHSAAIQRRTYDSGQPNMRVFIVEDSAPIRERLVEMIIEIGGFTVVGEAETAQQAIDGIRASCPDIAFFDIQLASGNGIEALIEARRERPDLKAIVLTNYATPQHEKASAEAGADYFLDKSADFESIAEILQSMKAVQNGTFE